MPERKVCSPHCRALVPKKNQKLTFSRDEMKGLLESGKNFSEIGQMVGLHRGGQTSVINRLKRFGLYSSPKPHREDLDGYMYKIINLYQNGTSTKKLAAMFDAGEMSISSRLKAARVTLRSSGRIAHTGVCVEPGCNDPISKKKYKRNGRVMETGTQCYRHRREYERENLQKSRLARRSNALS